MVVVLTVAIRSQPTLLIVSRVAFDSIVGGDLFNVTVEDFLLPTGGGRVRGMLGARLLFGHADSSRAHTLCKMNEVG